MGRKPISRTKKEGHVSFRVGKRMKTEFEKAAAEQDKLPSELGRELIEKYLKELKGGGRV